MIRRLVGRDTSLVTTLAPSLSQVKIDPLQMAQVVTNLGINAHNAMPNGGKLTLETRNVEFDDQLAKTYPDIRVGKYVMLSATDIGMTTEVNSERFETFFSTEDVDDRIDQSLLAVRGIVKHYGGHIEIESEPNGGTTIKLYFPVTEDEINS
jgi:two-component system cell cycle sensor histidine kinase/response regulator CckA